MSPASAAAEVAHGVPYGEGAYHDHGEEDNEHVEGMDTDGIGVDDEVATRRGEADETEGLLQPAQQEAEHDADDGAEEGDETALVEENAEYHAVGGSKMAQGGHVATLFDDEHGH